ncbi:SPASM domain-containing protein [Candidatus Desantisbacteria bacterium]|nr:SPASM domain-containing protein [Candidatus Desantisbacteria bacterium]
MKKFKRIYIEITNVCNLSCKFCPKTTRKPEFMSIDLFKKILNEIKDNSKYIYFHVVGEPLLHPDIDTFLDLCNENDFKVNITTNGTFIKEIKNKILFKPALRLMNFSLHCFENSPDNYLDEIFNFIDIASGNPDFIACLRLWYHEDLNSIDRNQYIIKKIEEFFKIPFKINEISTKGKNIKLVNNIYFHQAAFFKWPDSKIPDIGSKGFCLGLREQSAILVDGTVVPCCLDNEGTINLGNIKKNSFTEIIEGKRARELYKGFSERKIIEPLCRKCGYREKFNITASIY